MKNHSAFIIILTLILSSCQSKNNDQIVSVNGTWESLGYGLVMEIIDSTNYNLYNITSTSCLTKREGAFHELLPELKLKDDTLSLKFGVTSHSFIRTNNLPDHCKVIIDESKRRDPIYNFEVYGETVKDHYAFLELNNIDWNDLYQKQKSKLTSQSTDGELFLLIEDTMEKLNDNHSYLEASDEVLDAVDAIRAQTEETENQDDLPELGDFPVGSKVAEHHLQEELTKDSWLLHWGKLTDDIGYIQLKAMFLHADLEVPKELVDEHGYVDAYYKTSIKMPESAYVKKEVEGIRKTMNTVMNDLSDMKSIVIDVRFNGGGQDGVSFEILNHFTSVNVNFGSEKAKYGSKYTKEYPCTLTGKKDAYTKPVYVLTSTQTGSAAETFSLATMDIPHIKRIGTATQGAISSTLDKSLPNGWRFAVSNQVIMDKQGEFYENIGIPSDYQLDYPSERQPFFRSVVNNLEKDKSDILNAIKNIEAGK